MGARVAVVVPVHDQEAWLPAALDSLRAQVLTDWECVVVDDGSPGDVLAALGDVVGDPRVRVERLPANRGLGAALNRGLDLTTAPYVAYLPADDVLLADHLASLVAALDAAPEAPLAVAGCGTRAGRLAGPDRRASRCSSCRSRTAARRALDRALGAHDRRPRPHAVDAAARGREPVLTGQVTCTWTRTRGSGTGAARAVGRAQHLPRALPRAGAAAAAEHRRAPARRGRALRALPRAAAGARAPRRPEVLLVGELAHNPERILALAERGHELHGLWTDTPVWFNTVGPLPFGHVAEVPRERWREAVRELQPDVVYGLLNWQAVPVRARGAAGRPRRAVRVALQGGPLVQPAARPLADAGRPAPARRRRRLLEPRAARLVRRDAARHAARPSHVLDGDLPKAEWFVGEQSPLLSEQDGDVHTVIAGRPLGPPPEVLGELARAGVHVHVYSEKVHAQMRDWVEACRRLAPDHLHLHAQVDQADWVRVFSQYDAGWLHDVRSTNAGTCTPRPGTT
jgi:hypothetical protein